jgi:hypothetical protein
MRKIIVAAGLLALAGCATLGVSLGPPPPVYVVFFTGSAVDLGANGKTIIDRAAADAKLHEGKILQIAGPSTKAAPGYEPGLAETRMHIIEQALIDDGVASTRLSRTSLMTGDLKADSTGAQRVEIRLVDKPAS